MVITRKIEVFVCESDKDLRKAYYEKLYASRNIAVKVANMGVSHLFALDNSMPYLSEEDREKIIFLGTKGQKASKRNAPYVAASQIFKGQVNMRMIACLLNDVQKMYQEDRKSGMWNRSLRSYKSNIPMPFSADEYRNLRFAEYQTADGDTRTGCFFTLANIPFQMRFGRDRSNNRVIVERILSGEYKMCTSSIVIDDKKIFLLLCADIPVEKHKIDPEKSLYAFLGVMNPIIATCDVKARQEYDSGMKTYEIGTKEEFNYRRRQIQEAVKRCQINNRYSVGGKGRKKKCQAIERWHDKEKNYVNTKLHTYSRLLVDLAVKHRCGNIVLMNQTHREEEAKEQNANNDPFVLRNWTYYGLKEKIAYKCKLAGITLEEQK
jgi:IS605 OrfB family transposase